MDVVEERTLLRVEDGKVIEVSRCVADFDPLGTHVAVVHKVPGGDCTDVQVGDPFNAETLGSMRLVTYMHGLRTSLVRQRRLTPG